ncbi:MAG: RNA polymerase sigma-70 factor (ECF subfamily) [Oceanicoccus sp.]|jgi:RNA polymerase sigma-70 factor (ECF subfamily)
MGLPGRKNDQNKPLAEADGIEQSRSVSAGVQMTDAQQSDQQLVERVQQGDKRAFDLLVLKYQHKIFGLISRYIRDHDEIQDVAQEAFIKAYRALPRFRGDSAFYTWLYRIAINTAKNHLVSRNRRPPATDIDVADAEYYESATLLKDIENPENALYGEELKAVVEIAIKNLPEDLRTAVTLREFDGLSYEDIADVMECPVGTVRSRIFRAREAIDKQVKGQLFGVEPEDHLTLVKG